MRSLLFVFAFVLAALAGPTPASPAVERTFPAGSLIIPMDVDFQGSGMLQAYGLVDALLRAGIPVNWVVEPTKTLYTYPDPLPTPGEVRPSAVDLVTSATVVTSATGLEEPGDAIPASVIDREVWGLPNDQHGYRGGPFVIDAEYRDAAMPVVVAWSDPAQANRPVFEPVAVHSASASFVAPVARVLVNAPRIAVLGTGNEDIIFIYLRAAGIPDPNGDQWPAAKGSPALTPADVAGTTTDHRDGALFDDAGQPAYDQLLAATWGASRDATTTEAIAEIGEFLEQRTHLFAGNSAPIWIENIGHFLTTDNGIDEPTEPYCAFATMPDNGLCKAPQPSPANSVSFFNVGLVFAQLDGPFTTIGGSVPAYGLAPQSTYRDSGVVMIRDAAAAGSGVSDVWLTAYTGGSCEIASSTAETAECASVGKISYLGGHQYSTTVPIGFGSNSTTQGVRLFLNSLFEAGSIAPPPPPPPPPPAAVADTTAPAVTLVIKARQKLLPALRKGLRATAGCSEACAIQAKLLIAKKLAKRLKLPTVVGKATKNLTAAGTTSLVVKFTAKAKRKLRQLRSVRVTLELVAADAAGNAAKARKAVTLRR